MALIPEPESLQLNKHQQEEYLERFDKFNLLGSTVQEDSTPVTTKDHLKTPAKASDGHLSWTQKLNQYRDGMLSWVGRNRARLALLGASLAGVGAGINAARSLGVCNLEAQGAGHRLSCDVDVSVLPHVNGYSVEVLTQERVAGIHFSTRPLPSVDFYNFANVQADMNTDRSEQIQTGAAAVENRVNLNANTGPNPSENESFLLPEVLVSSDDGSWIRSGDKLLFYDNEGELRRSVTIPGLQTIAVFEDNLWIASDSPAPYAHLLQYELEEDYYLDFSEHVPKGIIELITDPSGKQMMAVSSNSAYLFDGEQWKELQLHGLNLEAHFIGIDLNSGALIQNDQGGFDYWFHCNNRGLIALINGEWRSFSDYFHTHDLEVTSDGSGVIIATNNFEENKTEFYLYELSSGEFIHLSKDSNTPLNTSIQDVLADR